MSALAKWASVVIPDGRWYGRRLGELLLEEDGPGWIRYAANRHPDTDVRRAAYGLATLLDEPSFRPGPVPTLVVGLPLEGRPWLRLLAPTEGDVDRLAAQIREDPGQAELVRLALALTDEERPT